MIESNFSCSSSWDLDPFKDLSDIPFIDFEDSFNSIDSISRQYESNSNSSDYDNEFLGDLDNIFPVTDSFISGILEENSCTGVEDEWSLLQNFESYSLPLENTSSSVRDLPKNKGKSVDCLKKKSWSKMSTEEQLETLHSLSKIVTCRMDIRDQMKVIKIIDPSAKISPNDTEFTLDISHLNDAKLKRILELVRKHKYSLSNSKKLKSSSKNSSSQKSSQTSKILSGRTNSKTKRKQKKQKICADKDIRQQRKLELHGLKEIQSGLFVYEKVIKLSNPLEDEDVNILE